MNKADRHQLLQVALQMEQHDFDDYPEELDEWLATIRAVANRADRVAVLEAFLQEIVDHDPSWDSLDDQHELIHKAEALLAPAAAAQGEKT